MGRRIALWVMGWLVAAHAAFGGELRVYTEDSPPFQWQEPGGEVSGVTTEVVRAMLKESNRTAQFQVVPWARAVEMAETEPDVLLYAMMRTPEREPKFAWIGTVVPFRTFFWKLKSRTDIKLRGLEDARKYNIGVVNQNAEQDFLLKNGFSSKQLQVVNRSELNIAKLFEGRVDLIPYNDLNLNDDLQKRAALKSYKLSDIELVAEIKELSAEAYLVMSKKSDPALVDDLKKSMQRVKDSGQYQKILARHGMRIER